LPSVLGCYYSGKVVSLGLNEGELEVQVRLPTAVLVLIPHPTDYLARGDWLADLFTGDRGRIEVSV
jgi:hypothetical protein